MDIGLIVDIETTGIDSEKDEIIEIGILEFMLEAGKKPAITNMYSALEDPGFPLSSEIKKITGLDDALLKGQKIDWNFVRKLFSRSSIAIAHNMPFDRGFLVKREELSDLGTHWACSMKHIDWLGHGFKTRALNYLAADHGFVNAFAHRALFDCATTFRLISPYIQELVSRSFLKEYLILAHQAPFATKDKLKENQYRWDARGRVWTKEVFEDSLEQERAFLKSHIYSGEDTHEERPM